jgi:hypothetical protein
VQSYATAEYEIIALAADPEGIIFLATEVSLIEMKTWRITKKIPSKFFPSHCIELLMMKHGLI